MEDQLRSFPAPKPRSGEVSDTLRRPLGQRTELGNKVNPLYKMLNPAVVQQPARQHVSVNGNVSITILILMQFAEERDYQQSFFLVIEIRYYLVPGCCILALLV